MSIINTVAAVSIGHLKNILSYNKIDNHIAMENNEEVIARLKFIGHIEKDEKINVKHVNRQPNTLYTKFSRSILYPDNRANSLKFVRDVILRSFEIIEHLLHHKDTLVSQGIVTDLIKAKQGMLNLKYTYTDDTKFCCDIDVLIEQVASKLTSLKEHHLDLFENTETKNQIV
jgi:hypothetical protein